VRGDARPPRRHRAWGTGGLASLTVTAAACLAAGITVFRVMEHITKIRGTLGAY
jgi:hypothetical protein